MDSEIAEFEATDSNKVKPPTTSFDTNEVRENSKIVPTVSDKGVPPNNWVTVRFPGQHEYRAEECLSWAHALSV